MFKCFDDSSSTHYMNGALHIHCGIKVMGDDEESDLELLMEFLQKVKDLFLQSDIQSAEGFVKNNILWTGCQSPGNTQPLLLPTGKLARSMRMSGSLQPYHIHELQAATPSVLGFHVKQKLQWFLQNGGNALMGVQRTQGVLHHQLNLAPDRANLFPLTGSDLQIIQKHLSDVRQLNVGQNSGQSAFPTPALSHK